MHSLIVSSGVNIGMTPGMRPSLKCLDRLLLPKTRMQNIHTSVRAAATVDASDRLYLHVAPCGDYWTGHEVFAAKHLNPDYVKSIPVPIKMKSEGADVGNIEYEFNPDEILQDYDGDLDQLLKKVYDTGDISLIRELRDN